MTIETAAQIQQRINDLVKPGFSSQPTDFLRLMTNVADSVAPVLDGSSANDTAGKAAILGTAGALIVPGAISPTGGINGVSGSAGVYTQYLSHTGGVPAQATGDGTDATPSVTETYLALILMPFNCAVTGISIFNGSATGSGSVKVYLATVAGAAVTGGASVSTAIAGTDVYQRVPFPAPITLPGPRAYFVLTQYNNTASRFNTHVFGDFPAGKLTSTTYGTFPTGFSAPSTFTTGLGPIASLY